MFRNFLLYQTYNHCKFLNILFKILNKMLIPEFVGGLGNMMFQFAATYSIAKQTGHDFGIVEIPLPPKSHSRIDYKRNIFSKWKKYRIAPIKSTRFSETRSKFIDINSIRSIPDSVSLTLYGFFQYEKYLRPFKKRVVNLFDLSIDDSILKKYEDIDNAYFLQIRRGDYVGNSFHELDLTNYYKKAVEKIGKGIAYIVSNDMNWCKRWDFLKSVQHRFIEENEVNTLIIMSKCGFGGISANSSYGWWGLYLNTDRPYLIIPERWYPHDELQQDGYEFKEATVLKLDFSEVE